MTTQQIHESLKGLSAESIIEKVKEAGFPTDNAFAEALWHGLSGNRNKFPNITSGQAAEIYRACGYEPFAGFPLQRA
jgi:hypothetical protein